MILESDDKQNLFIIDNLNTNTTVFRNVKKWKSIANGKPTQISADFN